MGRFEQIRCITYENDDVSSTIGFILDFNISVSAAYTRTSSVSEIVKVNLLASRDSTEEQSHGLRSYLSNSMGG